MKKIVEYLPLLSICFIYFGYCNLSGYYQEFMLDIYQYITTTEIIMSLFPIIVLISSMGCVILFQEFIYQPVTENNQDNFFKKSVITIKSNWIIELFRSDVKMILILFILYILGKMIMIFFFNFKEYDFQEYNIIAFMISIIICLCHIKLTGKEKIINKRLTLFLLFIVSLIGIVISNNRSLEAKKIKAGISTRDVIFKYNNSTISTNKDLMYVGQTSQYIFLYERITNKTFVYKFNVVDSLVILK